MRTWRDARPAAGAVAVSAVAVSAATAGAATVAAVTATTAGSAFPVESFDFTVHSVFSGAINFAPAGDTLLLSLVNDAVKAHPRAAVVSSARFDEWGLVPGLPGCFDGRVVRFGTARSAFPVIALPQVRRPAGKEAPATLSERVPAAARQASLRRAAAAIAQARLRRGLQPSLAELLAATNDAEERPPAAMPWLEAPSVADGAAARLIRSALDLEAAAVKRDAGAAARAATLLIGLGAGLTPAGDDFLCGWLAGQRAAAKSGGTAETAPAASLESFLDAFGALLSGGETGLAARTTAVSATFLAEAARGRFGAALVAFADAALGCDADIGRGDDSGRGADIGCGADIAYGADVGEAAAALLSLGHGSGADAAAGFLFSFRAEIGGWQ